MKKPLILIVNDDGINAPGIRKVDINNEQFWRGCGSSS